MIPPFNELGYLPPGIHPATLDEIDARFGQLSELRRVQMVSGAHQRASSRKHPAEASRIGAALRREYERNR